MYFQNNSKIVLLPLSWILMFPWISLITLRIIRNMFWNIRANKLLTFALQRSIKLFKTVSRSINRRTIGIRPKFVWFEERNFDQRWERDESFLKYFTQLHVSSLHRFPVSPTFHTSRLIFPISNISESNQML